MQNFPLYPFISVSSVSSVPSVVYFVRRFKMYIHDVVGPKTARGIGKTALPAGSDRRGGDLSAAGGAGSQGGGKKSRGGGVRRQRLAGTPR